MCETETGGGRGGEGEAKKLFMECGERERVYVRVRLQGGEPPLDAVSCGSLSAKEPLSIGFFCGKGPTMIRHPMRLRHPVCGSSFRRTKRRTASFSGGKGSTMIRHPMGLRHPIASYTHSLSHSPSFSHRTKRRTAYAVLLFVR